MSAEKKRSFEGWVGYLLILVVVLGGLLCIACMRETPDATQGTSEKKQEGENKDAVEKELSDAKNMYYEAQLRSLSTQLSDVTQRLDTLRLEYQREIEQLRADVLTKDETRPENGESREQQVPRENEEKTSENDDGLSSKDVQTATEPEKTEERVSDYTYYLVDGCAVLTSYCGTKKDVIIPAAVNGYRVVELADNVFATTDASPVVLPDTIESLGWFRFYGCENLQKIVLPEAVATIGYASFDGCPKDLCLYVSEGSYAEKFAISFGLYYQTVS
ncbi:MAG: leucine-rich repeat protein [Clostridia bacterium]|nr:leucine-rich repeat protein [Clostridia bacterium]